MWHKNTLKKQSHEQIKSNLPANMPTCQHAAYSIQSDSNNSAET